MKNDYESYIGHRIGIYTEGRIPTRVGTIRQAGSIFLEGLLESETENVLNLRKVEITKAWAYETKNTLKAKYKKTTVGKSKIIIVYEI